MAYADDTAVTREAVSTRFVANVYGWMFGGLLLTAGIAGYIGVNEQIARDVASSGLILPLIIVELLLVLAISFAINKMPPALAMLLFAVYSALNGVTLSIIFLAYTTGSIAGVFAATAGMFGVMSLYGYVTKRDLTTMGNLLFMALIGMIIAWVVNIFLHNDTLTLILSWLGVVIFTGLTAYDTQKIKQIGASGIEGTAAERAAIIGALALYLDFINLFLSLLRIFGSSRD